MTRPGRRRLPRLSGLRTRETVREVDEEMQFHIELRTAELIAGGLDPAAARAQALELFAQDDHTVHALYATAIERVQHMRMRERLESILHDLRYAARGFLREPALTAFILITLTLGIGANVTAWSLVDRLLLRDPAHVVEPDRVVRLFGEVPWGDQGPRVSSWMPYSAFLQFRELAAFETAGAYRITETLVGSGAEARRMRVGWALGGFFPMLGVRPFLGRLFGAEEDAATDGELVVLSHETWRVNHGGDAQVIGRSILVDDTPHTIVGVAPPGFTGTEPRRVDLWRLGSSVAARNTNWTVVGRLRPGATAEAAGAEATARHEPDQTGSFTWFRQARVFTAPLNWADTGREPIEATLARWLAGVTGIILLITFANVVNLLLVRLARRRRELAIRVALGAGRTRVVRLIAAEGALLAVASGAASLLVARLMEPMVRRAVLADQAGWTFSIADGRLLGLVGVIVLVTMLCVGTVPAWEAGDPAVANGLRGGGRAGSASFRVRSTLTVVQTALSVLLLVGAGLFLRSFANVRALNLGVDRGRVITVDAVLPNFSVFGAGVYGDFFDREREVFGRLESAVRRVPGVAQAAAAVGLPLDGGWFSAGVWMPDGDSIPNLPGRGPWVSAVTAGYFETIGTRIVHGRAFTDADREGGEPVIIINETMARGLWPGQEALGRCVHAGRRAAPCARVVGVAEDVHRVGLREVPSFQYYLPLGQQRMFGGARLVVRPAPGATVSSTAIRQAIVDAEPRISAVESGLLEESLAGEMRPLRIGMVTFGISGALALVVAVLGLYSLMSYLVAWRTHEIGVRVALGASRGDVVRLVLRGGVMLTLVGVAVGLGLVMVGGGWMESHLFETSARDVGVMVMVAVGLIGTAALAGWLPARRATRIDPTEALRAE